MKPNPYFFGIPCSSVLLNFVRGMFWALETPELPCSSAVSCPGKAAEQGQMMMYRNPGERGKNKFQLQELKTETRPCWELSFAGIKLWFILPSLGTPCPHAGGAEGTQARGGGFPEPRSPPLWESFPAASICREHWIWL